MEINNRITPRFDPSFNSIQRCCKLGSFSYNTIKVAQVENALENSKILQKYCSDNDIHMIMSADKLGYCSRNLWYASLDLRKIFPKPELSFWGKVVNLFKRKPSEAVVFRAYGDDKTMAVNKLVEFIDSIKSQRDLRHFISYRKYNPVEMDKCRTCGWNSEYKTVNCYFYF